MTDSVVSRSGQIAGAGAVDALFLKKFAGEVLTAYETLKLLKATVRVRTIEGAKSAKFDATYRAKARYHVPGTEILGQVIKHNEITITIDDLLISDAFVASIDELKNHYDVRAPYANELGGSLALFEDRTIAQCLIKAARGAALFTGDGAGQSVAESTVGMSADFTTSGNDLISAVNLGKQKLEENKVPITILPVRSIVLPAQWYLMANTDKNLNTQTGGQGASVAHQSLKTVSDVTILKSPAPLFGYDVTTYNSSTNTDGVVADVSGNAKAGYSAEDILPNDYPSKYQLDLTNTVGAVWCEPAVAYLQLKGLNMEVIPQPTKRGTLLLAEMAIGMDALRSKCSVELKKD